uniref:Uncharacterized protein LOC101490734 n=1 Tax=Cicer arietinum TaxID=3827 RepID=A0A1S2YFN0_CICAR|nr:uncharacterized protein LOC101490734 [Cicer arietinum]
MKLSELEAAGTKCKEHPNYRQLPGVCSYCLRDKLSKLCNNKQIHHVPQSPQPFSSTLSNYMSQAHSRRHRRHTSSVMDSASSLVGFDYELKKSKSVAFVSRSQISGREFNGDNKENNKKGSFWSKLLKLTRKDTKEAFMHSRTMRERKG